MGTPAAIIDKPCLILTWSLITVTDAQDAARVSRYILLPIPVLGRHCAGLAFGLFVGCKKLLPLVVRVESQGILPGVSSFSCHSSAGARTAIGFDQSADFLTSRKQLHHVNSNVSRFGSPSMCQTHSSNNMRLTYIDSPWLTSHAITDSWRLPLTFNLEEFLLACYSLSNAFILLPRIAITPSLTIPLPKPAKMSPAQSSCSLTSRFLSLDSCR